MTDAQLSPTQDNDRLKGWKEIALYLRTSDRTVQRWERSLRLPVHRIRAHPSAIVYASQRELETWLRSLDGRAALSEHADAGPIPEPSVDSPARSLPCDEPAAADQLDDGQAVANRAAPLKLVPVPTLRRIWRPAVALVAVALVGGGVMSVKSGSWHWSTQGQSQTSPSSAVGSEAVPPTAPKLPVRPPVLRLLLTFDDGTSAGVVVKVGSLAMCAIPGRATYALSAEFQDGEARVHVSSIEGMDPQGTPRLTELAVLTLRSGQQIPFSGLPGLSTMKWAQADQ